MANYHARLSDINGNSVDVIYHIPIPSANNRVNVNYRIALVGSGIGGITVMTEGNGAGQITTAEKTQIAAGEIFEYPETMYTNPGENAATIQARIDARYSQLVTIKQAELQKQLTYWGFSRNVA